MIKKSHFRIAIVGTNPPTGYSGGRYHAWMMTEALAAADHTVCFITNNLPECRNDFISFNNHKNIKFWLTDDLMHNMPRDNFDLVFLIPHMVTKDNPFYFLNVQIFAKVKRAKLILLNFETANWFNALSPFKRDPSIWYHWGKSSRNTNLILSSSAEGNKYAKQFFKEFTKNSEFDYCYPSINSVIADSVGDVKKEKRIMLMCRFQWAEHKGSLNLDNLFCNAMHGYTLVLIVGLGEIPSNVLEKLNQKAVEYDVSIEVKYKLTDYEKFKEIKRSSLMLFPSFFEGFGYPPVESQFCNTPCIAFDLPVLKEVSNGGLIYVEQGNWSQFKEKITEVLSLNNNYKHLRDNIIEVARFENYVKRIDRTVQQLMQQPPEIWFKRFVTLLSLYAELYAYKCYRFAYRLKLTRIRQTVSLGGAVLRIFFPEKIVQHIRGYIGIITRKLIPEKILQHIKESIQRK